MRPLGCEGKLKSFILFVHVVCVYCMSACFFLIRPAYKFLSVTGTCKQDELKIAVYCSLLLDDVTNNSVLLRYCHVPLRFVTKRG